MDFRRLSSKAKEIVDKRGGPDALKQDAAELKRIASGQGSLSDKAKAAAAALKDPGGSQAGAAQSSAAPAPAQPAEPTEPAGDPPDAAERAERKERRAERRERRAERHGGGAGPA